MTDIGELVSIAIDAPHKEEGCPFCRPKEEVNSKNCLRADFDEDTKADNDTDNSSGVLAKNLAQRPRSRIEILPGESAPIHDMELPEAKTRHWRDWVYEAGLSPVLFGAHHTIPGNDGLGKSNLYKKGWLGPVDDGPDAANIGYNINSANNGVWLPGNYAIRGAEHRPSQTTWSEEDKEFQKAYAFLAMVETKRQFHDAHKNYSKTIKDALNELEELMEDMAQDGCPMCGKGDEEVDPPYHLNSRLNAISNFLSRRLQGNPLKWKDDYLTSDNWGPAFVTEARKHANFGDLKAAVLALANK